MHAPARGIGQATLARLDEVAARESRPLLTVASDPPLDVRGRARKSLEDFAALFPRLTGQQGVLPPPAFIDLVLDTSGYREALKQERTPEAEARLENLEELVAAAEDYTVTQAEPTLAGFLDSIALMSDVDEWEQGQPRVTLMTLHAAKGLEFPAVFLTGHGGGHLPPRALPERA